MNSNGSYEFNLIENLDHSEPGQTNENINLEFGFDAIDDDGDRTDGIISINVKDDVPTIVTKQTKTISEAGLADNASISYTGTLANSYGQDGPGDIKPTGYVEVKEVTNGPLVELKSVGEVVEITATANGYVGMAGTRKVFEVSIDNNGDYKYTQFESIDHPDTSAADEVIWLKFQVAITDFDGDQKTSFIQVDVVDTAPVAVSDSAPVLEGQMVTGNVTDNDTVGADAPGKITEVDGQTVGVNGLTVVGQYGTLVIQQDGSYKYTANNNNPDGVDSFSYTLKDADGDTDTAKLDITVTKILDRFPPEATFGSNGSGEGEVLEDGSVFVPITGSLNGDAPQVLTVEVSGVPSDWTIVTGANNGSYNATTGTWTITLPEGQDYDGGLTFTPPADSDIDLTGLTVTATSTLVSDNSTSSTDTDGKVIVDAVADTPDVEAGADKMVEAGQSVALDISNALTDTDGSESLGVVTISGVPEGASLSAGTEVSPGVWEVAQADLAGIELNVPESLISSENKLSASETLVGTGNSSATEDGITIEAINLDGSQSLELSYVDANGFEAGVGVNGSGTDKVFRDEAIRVSFDTPATSAAISVGDIGENNVNAGIDFKVYVVGQVDPIILEFQTPAVAPDGGVVTFNITPADVNGAEIESVVVFSDESVGSLPRSSFILTDVCAEVCVDNLEIPLTVSVTSTESVTDEDFDLTNNEATNTDQVIVTVTKPEVSSKPIVTNAKDTIDETNLVSGNIMETGAVSANFGEDGPGTFEIDNRFMSSGADNGNLTHNGDDVVVIKFGNVYSGLAGNVEVFTMTLNTDGSYEFVLKENLDHDNPSEDNETISLNFGFNAVDSDGDKSPGVISICVKDDVPSIDDKARRIDEDGLKTADVISYTHTLNHSYGEDDAGSIDPTGNFVAKFQVGGPDVTLSSNGVDIVVDPTADGYVGMAGADKVFDLVVNDNGQYTYRQFEGIDHQDATNPDDVIWLKFEVQITDFDGDSDTAMIIVDVHDSAPVAVDDTTQAGEGQTVTGNIVDNDVVGADDPGSLVEVGGRSIDANGETIVGQYGTLVIQQDGSYEYTANTNDPEGVDTFSYTMKDSDGDMDTAELKIAVNPDYEPPKVTFGSNASGSGRVYEDGSVMVPIVALLSGTASQVLTVEVSGISPDWTITTGANNGTYNATTGTWTIILPEGQDYDGGLTFTPPTDSDIDLTGLNVKATSQFVGTNTSLSSTTDGVVIVDAVADKPEIDAGENFTTGAGQSVKLDISNQLVDTDGSESLGDVTISGVPEGYSLSAGTQILPGVWVVSQDDLSGLKLNVPDDMLVHETCGLNAISDLNIDGEPSVTRNGITVEAVNPKNGNTLELTFYDETPGFEPGIGVQSNGHPTDKVFGDREGLRVSFETPMTSMAVVLGDIGENNLDSGIDFKVYVVGQEEPISLEYKTPSTAASDGTAMFEITSADLNGAQIESFVVFSDASVNSDLPRSSFTLVNVECGADVHSQQFELVASVTTTESVTDSDFDLTNNMASSTDSVVIKVQGSNVGSQGHDDVSGGADNDVLFGLQGDDILYGDAGNDVLNGGEDNNLLYGGDGLDTFVMDADKAGNNDKFDTVADFNLDEGDVLSLSEVISGFDSGSDINDFVRINLDGDTAVVQINSDGGQGGNFYNVAKINSTADLDATSLNVQDLFDKGHIDVY